MKKTGGGGGAAEKLSADGRVHLMACMCPNPTCTNKNELHVLYSCAISQASFPHVKPPHLGS